MSCVTISFIERNMCIYGTESEENPRGCPNGIILDIFTDDRAVFVRAPFPCFTTKLDSYWLTTDMRVSS